MIYFYNIYSNYFNIVSLMCEISFLWCFIIFLLYSCFIYFNNYFLNTKPLICMFVFSSLITLICVYWFSFISINLFGGIFFIEEGDIMFRNIMLVIMFIVIFQLITSILSKGLVYVIEYYVLSYILIMSCMLILYCNDIISLFLFMEVQSIVIYIFISMKAKINELSMGIRYFILGSATAIIFIFCFSIIYSISGISSLYDFVFIDLFLSSNYCNIAVSMLYLLFMLKLYIFPFHYLGSDLYRYIPYNIIIILSTVMYNIYIYVFSKIVFSYACSPMIYLLFIVITIIFNIVNLLFQQDIRAFLGLGTSIHSSLLTLLLLLGINSNITIILLYTIIYILSIMIILIMFFNIKYLRLNMLFYDNTRIYNDTSLSSLVLKNSNFLMYSLEHIASWAGLFKYYKHLVFIMSFSLWSLAGLPPFSSFFAKLSILSICFVQNHIFIFIMFILLSIVSSLYYVRIIKEFFYVFQLMNYYCDVDDINYYFILFCILIISIGIFLPDFFIFYFC